MRRIGFAIRQGNGDIHFVTGCTEPSGPGNQPATG